LKYSKEIIGIFFKLETARELANLLYCLLQS